MNVPSLTERCEPSVTCLFTAKRHLPIEERGAGRCPGVPRIPMRPPGAHSAAPPLRPPATIPPRLCARSRTRRVIMILTVATKRALLRAGHPTCSSTRSQGHCDFQPPDTSPPPMALPRGPLPRGRCLVGAALQGAALQGAAGRLLGPCAQTHPTPAGKMSLHVAPV